MFRLGAVNWQADAETLPLFYAFEYLQRDSAQSRFVQGASQASVVSAMLPPGSEANANVWALQLRISNIVGSETVATTCNMHAGDCLVTVTPMAFASADAMLEDLSGRSSAVQELINAGDSNAAINYVSILLQNVNSANVGARRKNLLAINDTAVAAYKCGTAAPLLYGALPAGGLLGYPSAGAIARNCIASTLLLFSVKAQVNDQCLVEMKKIFDVVLEHTSKGCNWAETPDLVLLQDLSDTVSSAIDAVQLQYTSKHITRETTAVRMSTLITQHENITAVRAYGSLAGEAAKTIDSKWTRSKSWRINTPTASVSARGWHRTPGHPTEDSLTAPLQVSFTRDRSEEATSSGVSWAPQERSVYAGGRRLLATTYPGTTRLSALSGSFTQSVFSMPENVLPFVINKVECSTGSNGAQLCEEASVSLVATHFVNNFNPHFYSEDSVNVIGPVMTLQLQAFGMQEVIPVENLDKDITFDLVLTRVPDSTQDVPGRHRVAACVWWNGTKWDTSGCMLDKVVQADDGGNDMRAICHCNHTSAHTVLDAPAGCDSIPYSTKLFDGCRVCGGDGSSCIGCDGKVASGKVIDGCGKCGGDNSTCWGCDYVPNSGLIFDECNVCGGDNSTCRGCDGVSVHPYVTARFPATLGFEWLNVGTSEPADGYQLVNAKLQTELGSKTVFTQEEWTAFGISGLHVLHFVKSGVSYFKPIAPKKPKEFDNCKSAEFPFGVCGGCDSSCKGCDAVANSGKIYDKCGRCGEFVSAEEAANVGIGAGGWYARTTEHNCSLGLKKCASGFLPDDCGTCVPFGSGSDVRNQACKGCDNVGRVFSYQRGARQLGGLQKDTCGLCGGNDCSCVDCKGVVGGTAKDDRCGICQGNNTCLDCAGVPYGPNLVDICGICGDPKFDAGWNNTERCRGCDGRLYPVPLKAARLDRLGQSPLSRCCPAELIGCNDICNASVGCDGNCTTRPKLTDKCGVCGGSGAANTGSCDCAGGPNGRSAVGCDGVCSDPPQKIDTCGVCGGTNQRETGHCDCENMPFGRAVRDSSGVCCYLSDMGCAKANQSRCFSGKTWDVCNTCGGDGGTCVQSRPSSASRIGAKRSAQHAFIPDGPGGALALGWWLALLTLFSVLCVRLH